MTNISGIDISTRISHTSPQATRDCFKSKEWISEDEINGFMDELNNEARIAQYLVGDSGSFNVVLL